MPRSEDPDAERFRAAAPIDPPSHRVETPTLASNQTPPMLATQCRGDERGRGSLELDLGWRCGRLPDRC
jgi:hypothetical protein